MAFTALVGARVGGAKIRSDHGPRDVYRRVRQIGTLYCAFVRSVYAHAKLTSVDVKPALSRPAWLRPTAVATFRKKASRADFRSRRDRPARIRRMHYLLAIDEVALPGTDRRRRCRFAVHRARRGRSGRSEL